MNFYLFRDLENRYLGVFFVLLAFGVVGQVKGQIYPSPVPDDLLSMAPYSSAGIVDSEVGTGSGAVARDARLIYTCAHVVFERGRWAENFRFARAHHSNVRPGLSAWQSVRGIRYYSGYRGGERKRDFSLDFAIGYGVGTSNFGPVLPVLQDGVDALRSSANKLILGYPAYLDYTGERGVHFQHRTGPFSNIFRPVLSPYMEIKSVSTGPGNSGGPVLVEEGGNYHLAGVLVSGYENGAGVHALNASAYEMGTIALALASGVTIDPNFKTASSEATLRRPVRLPDGADRFVRRALRIRGALPMVVEVKFGIHVAASYQGDLDIFLRSPRGRTAWLIEHDTENSGGDFVLEDEDLTEAFSGTRAGGRWFLFARDYFQGEESVIVSATLRVKSQ